MANLEQLRRMNVQKRSAMGLKKDRVPATLGDEEEAWYRHEASPESSETIKAWIHEHHYPVTHSESLLGDEEEAWVRR